MGLFKDMKNLKKMAADAPPAPSMSDTIAAGASAVATAKLQQQLLATGVPGTAIVKSADQSGMMVNNMPQVDFDFEVTLPGKDAYSVKTSLVVPMTQLAAVAAGNTVGVLVDPANPESLMFDWSRPQG
jgi:hypothetical protein